MAGFGRPLPRSAYGVDPVELAPRLLNKVLCVGDRAGRIVEVEAYREDDPASHSYRGRTPRTEVMFGPPGHLYVYRSYGIHACCNVVCGDRGHGAAVLVRAVAPLVGIDEMWAARPPARRERDLCSGPGKLTEALGIELADDGADLCARSSHISIRDDGMPPPDRPGVSRRIGISVAVERPWRFFVSGDPNLSGRAAGPGAG